MRRIVYHKQDVNDEESKNPRLLLSSDIQAFHVCREFLEALRTGTQKAIQEANQDLAPYFNHIRSAWKENEYYTF
jgi:hypothetical protein